MVRAFMVKTIVVAALAAGCVWLVMAANFDPAAYVDHRPYCSAGSTLPYTDENGVRVEPTARPNCRYGPLPAEALGPSPVPAIATFLLVGGIGYLVGAPGTSTGRFWPKKKPPAS